MANYLYGTVKVEDEFNNAVEGVNVTFTTDFQAAEIDSTVPSAGDLDTNDSGQEVVETDASGEADLIITFAADVDNSGNVTANAVGTNEANMFVVVDTTAW